MSTPPTVRLHLLVAHAASRTLLGRTLLPACIERYLYDTSFQEFSNDSMCRDAVLHNLLVISASVTRLPASIRAQHPQVERWTFTHDASEHEEPVVDWARMWDAVQHELPPLNHAIRAALRQG